MKNKLFFLFVLLIVALFAVGNAYAMGPSQAADPAPAGVGLLDAAFLLTITAFFKKQFNLSGWPVMVAAFIVALILYLPTVFSLPAEAVKLLGFAQWFIASMGSVDLSKDVLKSLSS